MALRDLFRSGRGVLRPTDTLNRAGGTVYALPPKEALAQLAVTSCLGGAFYESAEGQLIEIIERARNLEDRYLAQVAIYAREHGRMKDLPALLAAILAGRGAELVSAVFPRVIDTPRQLRTFVQIVRSGVTGRRSFGSRVKRLIEEWLAARSDDQLIRGSHGRAPSLADIVRMIHPKPATESRAALYGSLIGRLVATESLPDLARELVEFRAGLRAELPDVPLPLLSGYELTEAHWRTIAERAPWQTTRASLNTFARHGVFQAEGMTEKIAARLADRDQIRRARAQPYQILVGVQNLDPAVPNELGVALLDALEIATENTPAWPEPLAVCVDVSGSMFAPITGYRRGATSTARCVDVAALIAATVLRRVPTAEIVPFDLAVRKVRVRGIDSIATTAERLASLCGGGTDCSSALRHLRSRKSRAQLVVFVSDNQSWFDARRGESALMKEWAKYAARVPGARLVCLDLQPYADSPAHDRRDVLNLGGFSDVIFERIDEFARTDGDPAHWVEEIEAIEV